MHISVHLLKKVKKGKFYPKKKETVNNNYVICDVVVFSNDLC